MIKWTFVVVACCGVGSASVAEQAAVGAIKSQGIYRLPYDDGITVKVFDDFTTHRPRGRIDFFAVEGQRPYGVVAAAAGRVMAIQDTFGEQQSGRAAADCHNNYVWLQHANGEWTNYSHLAQGSVSNLAKLKVGDFVAAGAFLGYEAAVGCAMLDHVHFEVAVPDPKAPIDSGGFLLDNEGGKRERSPQFCNVPGGTVVKDATYRAAACTSDSHADKPAPLTIGETFTIESRALQEMRRINVYFPPGYAQSANARVPVLYMPDGGMAEDFLHVAGLVQVGVGNQTMRPFLLVGIENTERRRDMTGPTDNAEDRKIAPRVGGSAAFRKFIREELMPQVSSRYRTTEETAIVGESLAGLFVIETLLLEPDLFDVYLAFDPSLWWNDQWLVNNAAARLQAFPKGNRTLYFASSDEQGIATITQRLAKILDERPPADLHWQYVPMPEEKHSTIYHPAALKAFRAVLKPAGT